MEQWLIEEREQNLPLLQALKEKLDSGKLPRNKKTFVDNPMFPYKWVQCFGVCCSIKATCEDYTCPLEQKDCWWVDAHNWRIDNEKDIKGRLSFMRKYSDI